MNNLFIFVSVLVVFVWGILSGIKITIKEFNPVIENSIKYNDEYVKYMTDCNKYKDIELCFRSFKK